MAFQLDTSGVVVAHGYRRVGATPVTSYEWSDLSPFCQGYTAAILKEANAPFHKLAPATLSRIIADCELFAHDLGVGWEGHGPGQQFWRVRSEEFDGFGPIAGPDLTDRFPPLTVYLGEDGLIYFREAA